jgi:hypothetical protein
MLATDDLHLIKQAIDEPEREPLTIERYRITPVRRIQSKYQSDPAFKAGVEK